MVKYSQRSEADFRQAFTIALSYRARVYVSHGGCLRIKVATMPDCRAAAEILGVTERSIRNYVIRGKLNYYPGSKRFAPDDLIVFLFRREEERKKRSIKGHPDKDTWAELVKLCIKAAGGEKQLAEKLLSQENYSDEGMMRGMRREIRRWRNGDCAPNRHYRAKLLA